ncbi:hypothetical protein [Mariprofundus sp. EBB-1]|nr:hypothetical protein [Mariprofundus sp. EBB-1]
MMNQAMKSEHENNGDVRSNLEIVAMVTVLVGFIGITNAIF